MSEPTPLEKFRQDRKATLDALATEFGINKSTMLRWERGQVPADRVLDVEAVTGISRHELRPDVFGPKEGAAA